MKNIKLMRSLTVFSAALMFQIFSAAGAQAQAIPQCSSLTGGAFPGGGECLLTPTTLTFKIYELSLCTGAVSPTTTAIQKAALCETLFESTAGEDVDLTPGASFSMDDGFAIAEDTYTHGLLKMNTTFSMTTAHEFTQSYVTDDDFYSSTDTSGAFCFSNGNDVDPNVQTATSKSQITCHASAFSALPNNVISKMFGTPASPFQMNTEIATPNTIGSLTAYTDLYILKADSSLATGDVTYSGSGVSVNPTHDRKYILADQTLTNPVVITSDTKGLDIQFNVTDSASLEWNGANKISANAFNGLLFIFSAN